MSQDLRQPITIHITDNSTLSDYLSQKIRDCKSCLLIVHADVTVQLNIVGSCKIKDLSVEVHQNACLYFLTDNVFKTITIICYQSAHLYWCSVVNSSTQESQHMSVNMAQEHCKVSISIFPFVKHNQKLNLYTEQIHNASHTHSTCNVVGSVGDNVLFKNHGKIVVKQKLNSINVDQHAQLILFGKPSYLSVIPELDIQSNSVTCTHGAAIGSFEKESVWYLTMRGINVREANNKLFEALCLKSVETITYLNFRKEVEEQIQSCLE